MTSNTCTGFLELPAANVSLNSFLLTFRQATVIETGSLPATKAEGQAAAVAAAYAVEDAIADQEDSVGCLDHVFHDWQLQPQKCIARKLMAILSGDQARTNLFDAALEHLQLDVPTASHLLVLEDNATQELQEPQPLVLLQLEKITSGMNLHGCSMLNRALRSVAGKLGKTPCLLNDAEVCLQASGMQKVPSNLLAAGLAESALVPAVHMSIHIPGWEQTQQQKVGLPTGNICMDQLLYVTCTIMISLLSPIHIGQQASLWFHLCYDSCPQ